jgi:hypothetical protein
VRSLNESGLILPLRLSSKPAKADIHFDYAMQNGWLPAPAASGPLPFSRSSQPPVPAVTSLRRMRRYRHFSPAFGRGEVSLTAACKPCKSEIEHPTPPYFVVSSPRLKCSATRTNTASRSLQSRARIYILVNSVITTKSKSIGLFCSTQRRHTVQRCPCARQRASHSFPKKVYIYF